MITNKQAEEACIVESLCEKAGTPQGLREVERQVLINCSRNLAKIVKGIHSDKVESD